MAQLEFLERLQIEETFERWIVRDGGVLCSAYVHDGSEGQDWLEHTAEATRAWVGFSHPGVGALLRCEWIGDKLVVVTADQRGPSMLQAARQLAELPAEREAWAVGELIAVGEALAAMARHQRGFVHRRANDEQLVVGADGHVQLRAPIVHVSVGQLRTFVGRSRGVTQSFQWMSPEQLKGYEPMPASDVYQLAATLYAALAGEAPFSRRKLGSDFDLLQAIVKGPPPPSPPASTPELAAVVMRGLARDPADRYVDPAALAAALRACELAAPTSSTFTRLTAWGPQARPAPVRSAAIVGDRCRRRWDELTPTTDDGIRHCASCQHDVVRVRSIAAIIPLLGKRCLSFRELGDHES